MSYRGKSLKAIRESKQLKLSCIASQTRIGLRYLSDLEEERFDRFPGKFYFSSFTKEYARSLGLDPTEVAADLDTVYEKSSPEFSGINATATSPRQEDGFLKRISTYVRSFQEV